MSGVNHGGKRKGAGRPVTGQAVTAVVRVDAALVPAIKDMKKQFKLDGSIAVTEKQDSIMKAEVVRLTAIISELELELLSIKTVSRNSGVYDGNSKDFKSVCQEVLKTKDNNAMSNGRKKAYEALGIVPKGGGKLSNDNERLMVYNWLVGYMEEKDNV